MDEMNLYLHALRVAKPRQLRGRLTRPLRRRRFPGGAPPRSLSPIGAAEPFWRSDAFAAASRAGEATRLARFQAHYGEDVLAAARAGDAARAAELLETWIAVNPPQDDDAWHPYPLSTRVGNWIAAVTLVPELATETVSDSAWRQLRRLEHNVEHEILGNHVIRNARALVLGGVAYDAAALRRRGLDLLRRELPGQVLADGGHYERSPAYHLLVLRDLLEVRAASPQPWLEEAIERMRAFGAALLRPDGAPALFNDGTVDAPRLDLPTAPDGVAVFEQSGFVVVRDGPLWLAFRCGVAAPAFLPPHAHADALSLQVWWEGMPVIVDAGSSTYEAGPERAWERGTAAHSTIRVDGRDQFRIWGPFRSGPLARVDLLGVSSDSMEARVALGGGIAHVRRVEWDVPSRTVTVADTVEGDGSHDVESRVVWAPDAPRCALEFIGEGETVVEDIWVSDGPGHRVPTTASVLRARVDLPVRLGFRLILGG